MANINRFLYRNFVVVVQEMMVNLDLKERWFEICLVDSKNRIVYRK